MSLLTHIREFLGSEGGTSLRCKFHDLMFKKNCSNEKPLDFAVSFVIAPGIDFPGGSDGKAPVCNAGRPRFDPWVGKIPWRSKWQPTPVLLPGKYYGWRSLVGYSLWGRKESDTI